MTLKRVDKERIVANVRAVATDAQSVVAADYRGITVADMDQLRNQARESGVHVQVVRNKLAKLAFSGTRFECINDALTGPLVLLFSMEEPGAAAKVLVSFLKKHEVLDVKALTLGETLLAGAQLKAVSSLPTRLEALAILAGTLNAPVTKLARTCQEMIAGLARVLHAVGEQQV